MHKSKIFIVKCLSIDAHRSLAIPLHDISSLDHKFLDNSVEFCPIVGLSIDSLQADFPEISHSFGRVLPKQSNYNPSQIFLIMHNVQEDLWSDFVSFCIDLKIILTIFLLQIPRQIFWFSDLRIK